LASQAIAVVQLRILLTLGLMLVTGLPVLSQDEFKSALDTLPGNVRDVKSAGRWRTAEATGVYRVIVVRVGYEHIADRLYIQWLSNANDDSSPQAMATVGVSEINDAGPFTFAHALSAEATNRLRITVNARHTYTGARRQFVFVASAPGTYADRTTGHERTRVPKADH
jgi:hypothetical protein